MRATRPIRPWEDERGYTLQEVLTAIAILGVLMAIAAFVLLALLERWRLDAAVEQLASDLRLAHSGATNQLTDWRVVLVPERAGEDEGPDYYLMKLNEPYDSGDPPPGFSDDAVTPRTLPADVRVMNQEYGPLTEMAGLPIVDLKNKPYYLSPDASLSPDVPNSEPTRTVELNSDGAMTGYWKSPSGTVRVTIDESPDRSLTYLAATARIAVD